MNVITNFSIIIFLSVLFTGNQGYTHNRTIGWPRAKHYRLFSPSAEEFYQMKMVNTYRQCRAGATTFTR